MLRYIMIDHFHPLSLVLGLSGRDNGLDTTPLPGPIGQKVGHKRINRWLLPAVMVTSIFLEIVSLGRSRGEEDEEDLRGRNVGGGPRLNQSRSGSSKIGSIARRKRICCATSVSRPSSVMKAAPAARR